MHFGGWFMRAQPWLIQVVCLKFCYPESYPLAKALTESSHCYGPPREFNGVPPMAVSQDPPRDGGEPEALGRNPGNRMVFEGCGLWIFDGDRGIGLFGAWVDTGHGQP